MPNDKLLSKEENPPEWSKEYTYEVTSRYGTAYFYMWRGKDGDIKQIRTKGRLTWVKKAWFNVKVFFIELTVPKKRRTN